MRRKAIGIIGGGLFKRLSQFRGVNLSALEQGATVPGVYNTDYTSPTNAEVDYYKTKGMNVIRVPFLWERIQRTQNTALATADLGYLTTFTAYAVSQGMTVVLDMHNYARAFGNVIGSTGTPNSAYADVWGRIAAVSGFINNSKVVFGLMNEPHDIADSTWLSASNAAIAAIRGAGANNLVAVTGTNYSGAWQWVSGGSSTTIGGGVVDSANNYIFEVHQYLDPSFSGVYSAAVTDSSTGPTNLAAATSWARSAGKKLFLGETGVPGDTSSVAALSSMMSYIAANSDVWWGTTYFAGGPWWGGWAGNGTFGIIIEPNGSVGSYVDSPQMGGYALTGGSGGGGGGVALALDNKVAANASSGTSLALPALTTTAGNVVVILFIELNGAAVSSVTDTAGHTWAARANGGATGFKIFEYYTTSSSALSSCTITVNFDAACSFASASAFGVLGGNISSPFDTNASVPASAGTAGATTSVTTNASNTMIVSGYRMGSTASPTAGSGFTQIAGANFLLTQYKIVTSTQTSLAETLTTGSGDSNGGVADVLVKGP